ncbi:MAG: Abi family protein [Lachnospiraceae bacterium]|nr:Abi family protein [Lachnospiraceae bacterium]
MEVKTPKTYEEQVQCIADKGFLIEDKDNCIAFLKKANYYRLSAYFLPFKKKDGSYFSNISFHRIQRIYDFDSHIRALLFETIEEIECYLRTQLSYYSAHTYGPMGYLEADNFSQKHNKEKYDKKIQTSIEENARTLVVKHHKEQYDGYFPIWVIIEFFSMGMLSYFYNDMKTADQKKLAKEMYGTSPTCLMSWLRCVTDLRNRCAHYARLYYWMFPAMPKIPKDFVFIADRKLFTQIAMLKLLYVDNEKWNSNVVTGIEALIEEFEEDIFLKHIGFPTNWKELLIK